MTNPYRAICAELVELSAPVDSIPRLAEHLQKLYALADRARALLAQPVADGPTDDELWALGSDDFCANCWPTDAIAYARAVLARWGNPTPQPVAVSERWPEQEDCDEQGRCWWLKQRANPDHDLLMPTPMPTWHLQRQRLVGTTFFRFTHWLPANALPTPTR